MSSIEKAIERMIAKKKKAQNEGEDFGVVEDIKHPVVDGVDYSGSEQTAVSSRDSSVVSASSSMENDELPHTKQGSDDFSENRICHFDFRKLEKSGFLTPEKRKRGQEEEYRIIKRPILQNAFNQGAAPVEKGNLIAVTSAQAGEGKTYTALNLAISMSMEVDTTILLVDGDVIRASLSKQLGLSNEPGLMEVLRSKKELSDVILASDMSNLKILPSGRLTENPTELLSSKRMRNLIHELAERYSDRVILFDTPPLLETTEASVIADMMGQVLVVVEATRTGNDKIKSAVEKINPGKVIGMILNKNRRYSEGDYYGGYYGSDVTKNKM